MRLATRVFPLFLFSLALAPSALAAADKSLSASGTVSKVRAAQRTVSVAVSDGSEILFVWNTDTRINGTLTPGAKVTVRYTPQTDGTNLANQISVVR